MSEIDTAAIRLAYSVDDGWTLRRERVLSLCDEIDRLREDAAEWQRRAEMIWRQRDAADLRADKAEAERDAALIEVTRLRAEHRTTQILLSDALAKLARSHGYDI